MDIDNEEKYFLVLDEGQIQELDNTTITVQAKHSINFTRSRKFLCLSLYYNGNISFLFINATKYINLKQKTLK